MIAVEAEQHAERLAFVTASGRHITGVCCTPRDVEPRGHVVLPPGYQQRIHHLSVLSRYLVRHGYATVRFDLTNHIGLSEGEIADFTMSAMAEDIGAVLDTCAEQLPGPQLVTASSLGARATIRALADRADRAVPAAVVLVLPVVDVEYTTTQAIGYNVVERWRRGDVTDPATMQRVLDHEVHYGFARDLIEHRFDDLAHTRRELSAIAAPITAIAAERDDWIDLDDLATAMAPQDGQRAPRRTLVLEATSHDLSNNPPVVRLLVQEILTALATSTGERDEVAHLEFDEIVETVSHERALKRDGYDSLPAHPRLRRAMGA